MLRLRVKGSERLKKETRLSSNLSGAIKATKPKILKKYKYFNALPHILNLET
ncbi:MAG: hypothetical protein ACUZ9M_02375 [Candidatus Scalindua sp.]